MMMARNKGSVAWYYKRGWAWIALLLSVGNTLAIWYNFLGFNALFDTVWMFALVLSPLIIIGSVIFGYLDTYKGSYGGETVAMYEANPFFMEMMSILREVKELLTE